MADCSFGPLVSGTANSTSWPENIGRDSTPEFLKLVEKIVSLTASQLIGDELADWNAAERFGRELKANLLSLPYIGLAEAYYSGSFDYMISHSIEVVKATCAAAHVKTLEKYQQKEDTIGGWLNGELANYLATEDGAKRASALCLAMLEADGIAPSEDVELAINNFWEQVKANKGESLLKVKLLLRDGILETGPLTAQVLSEMLAEDVTRPSTDAKMCFQRLESAYEESKKQESKVVERLLEEQDAALSGQEKAFLGHFLPLIQSLARKWIFTQVLSSSPLGLIESGEISEFKALLKSPVLLGDVTAVFALDGTKFDPIKMQQGNHEEALIEEMRDPDFSIDNASLDNASLKGRVKKRAITQFNRLASVFNI